MGPTLAQANISVEYLDSQNKEASRPELLIIKTRRIALYIGVWEGLQKRSKLKCV